MGTGLYHLFDEENAKAWIDYLDNYLKKYKINLAEYKKIKHLTFWLINRG